MPHKKPTPQKQISPITTQNKHEENWAKQFLQLRKFCETHHRLPSANEDPKLYAWQHNQRTKKNMPKYRIKLLNSIPEWKNPISVRWMKSYKQYLKTIQNGTPSNEIPTGLDYWKRTQKKAYRAGQLEDRKILLLEKIPRWTWINDFDQQWLSNSKQMINFIYATNRWPLANNILLDEYELYQWWNKQTKRNNPKRTPFIERLKQEKQKLETGQPLSNKKELLSLLTTIEKNMEKQ